MKGLGFGSENGQYLVAAVVWHGEVFNGCSVFQKLDVDLKGA